jgi:hypothetical protein
MLAKRPPRPSPTLRRLRSQTLEQSGPLLTLTDMVGNEAIHRAPVLSVPEGCQPLHPLLPLTGRLLRMLDAILESAGLTMSTRRRLARLAAP